MPSETEMSPVQIAARVAVLWEDRDDGNGGDLWEQLLDGSLDTDRGALDLGETWKTVFETHDVSLFQSIYGGVTGAHVGQSGYALADALLVNARASTPSTPDLLTSIAHAIIDIRAVLGDGDAAVFDSPHRHVDLSTASTVPARLLPRPLIDPGPRSVANSIGQLDAAIADIERKLEVAVTEIRIALGDISPTSIESPIAFDPSLPWDHASGTSEGTTIATAFRDVHVDRLDRTDDGIARLEQRIRDLESRT